MVARLNAVTGRLTSGTVALLCADVSRLTDPTSRQIQRIGALHDGVYVAHEDDRLLLVFRTASRAVDAALAMHRDLIGEPLRVGVHAAERVVHGRNDFGE